MEYFKKALDAAPEPRALASHEPALLIVPHIDFRVNLDIYAMVYKRLLAMPVFPETFIILGVGHRCPYEFSSCPLDYETVFGRTQTDEDLWNEFQNNCRVQLPRFPSSFDGEHSIEFVVVWLQALQRLMGNGNNFKILPMLMNGLHESMAEGTPPKDESEIGSLFTAFKKLTRGLDPQKTCIIASIDGCHVGPRFQHPFAGVESAQKGVQNWENQLWELCRSDKFNEFFQHLSSIQNIFYFDGVGVLTLLLKTFHVRAVIEAGALWYEDADKSFVTFTGGSLVPLS